MKHWESNWPSFISFEVFCRRLAFDIPVVLQDHHRLRLSRAYGQTKPVFTNTYVGFAKGESNSVLDSLPMATTTATETNAVRQYAIALVEGLLTVAPATIIASADAKSRFYGEVNSELTISYSAFANGENATVPNTLPTANTTADKKRSSKFPYSVHCSSRSDCLR